MHIEHEQYKPRLHDPAFIPPVVVAVVVTELVDAEVALVVTAVVGVGGTVDSVVTGQVNCSPALKLVHSVQ